MAFEIVVRSSPEISGRIAVEVKRPARMGLVNGSRYAPAHRKRLGCRTIVDSAELGFRFLNISGGVAGIYYFGRFNAVLYTSLRLGSL